MCHPLPLSLVDVECTINSDLPGIEITSLIRCEAKTGAEMEALTAVAVAALTIVDMAKSADRWMTISSIGLLESAAERAGRSDVRRTVSPSAL